MNEWLEISPDLEKIARIAYRDSTDLENQPGPVICPAQENIFRAFTYFSPRDTKVVILGQDPYHHTLEGKYKAWGLSFGYNPEWSGAVNSSLLNVLAEVERNEGPRFSEESFRDYCSLESWAKQGVLLLNTRLTVEAHKPMSHAGIGWEKPVGDILNWVFNNIDCVFLLWGAEARKTFEKATGINIELEAPVGVFSASHPCKYSAHRGFNGCGHFSKANEWLVASGQEPIKWV